MRKKKLTDKDEAIIEDYKNGSALMGKLNNVIDELEKVKFRPGVPGILSQAYAVYNSLFFEFVQPFYKRFK